MQRRKNIALGTLMACLLLGNVGFAADLDKPIAGAELKLNEDTTLTIGSGEAIKNSIIDLNGNTLTVTGGTDITGVTTYEKDTNISKGTLEIENTKFAIKNNNWSNPDKVITIDVENLLIKNTKEVAITANHSKVDIKVSGELSITNYTGVTATQNGLYATAEGTLEVTAGSIYSAIGKQAAKVSNGSSMTLTSTDSNGGITLTTQTDKGKGAIDVRNGSDKVKNNTLEIKSSGFVNIVGVSDDSTVDEKSSGISILNNEKNIAENKITINAEKDVFIKGDTGININSIEYDSNQKYHNQLIINSNTEIKIEAVETGKAINATSGADVKINENGNADVVVDGDIIVSAKGENDKSTVNVNFATADSVLNGKITTGEANAATSMEFAKGATWNNNGTSNVTNLAMNGGVIKQDNDAAHTIEVENYSGTGNIVLHADGVDADGTLNITSGGVTINNAAEKSVVNVSAAGDKIDSFDLSKAQASLEELANQITFNGTDENLSGTVKLEEGLVSSGASADISFDQNDDKGHIDLDSVDIGSKETATMRAMRDIASTAIVAWRQEDSTLSQRLGELRNSDGDQGIWTRMSRGEFEYDGAYKNQYNFFQLGYDKAYGDWHYGAAISYNDGKTTYAEGSGENSSTSLSLYGTWLGDKGHYADIVLKQGRLSNEFDTYAAAGHTHGDYDAWGTSLSGEYGRKTELNDGWYVTPQAQLTLMRIGGESYTTDNGISVDQETLNSAVGRVGFEIGKTVNDKGAVYAKASVLHEFAGNADTYLSLNGIHNSYSQDIGGTWYEAGIGVSYKTSSDSYIYADVVRTFGGDVETPWQWNAGVRYSF